ncbi:PLP-dependent lyase/thiolase [Candidatus Dojkabacteria bacterium]|uniref:PLP-dependent lyase/thiolase n=1 Tax=Candidatus Dojkabacteria bacterium TaxID=2099670 RepID=A0A955L8G8_9BACT|nr:PLP-dependent lyase/thiolase [Candidatus Dojkabacteria bacterium]
MSIWHHKNIGNSIAKEFQKTLNEGNTPLELKQMTCGDVYFKHEELNPNESFKDRSLAFQIAYYVQNGHTKFAISSSGNAARSAAAYCALAHVQLDIFVSPSIPVYKREKLIHENDSIRIHTSKRAKSDAIKFSRETDAINLRGSVDEHAITGFKTLGYELAQECPGADAVFICCSSGTSTVGLYRGLIEMQKENGGTLPAIHVVQSTKIHPIAKEFDEDFNKTITHKSQAISDKVAHRKREVIDIINNTGGSGWVVSDREVELAKEELNSVGVTVEGFNAYVSYAGIKRAHKNGYMYSKPICILSGI